jgi:hypothetical protein
MRHLFFSNQWLPSWTRRDHPIVRWHLHNPALRGMNTIIFGSSVILFLVFGGLSLPMLYFLMSLLILLYLAVGTTRKIQYQQDNANWELILSTPLPRADILLGTWTAGIWQINRTWLMALYRLMQALVVIGVLVFGLWFAEIQIQQWLVMLLMGTLVILVQPYAEMYLGGMIGLWSAHFIRDRMIAQGFSIIAVLFYWLLEITATLALLVYDLQTMTLWRVALALFIPVLMPLLLGFSAFQMAKRRLN